MTQCYFCGKEMKWDDTYTKEECGIEGKGNLVVLSCLNCGASADFYESEGE